MRRPLFVFVLTLSILSISCSNTGKELLKEPEDLIVTDTIQEAISTTIIPVEDEDQVLSLIHI